MKVLVIGGTGQVGSQVVRELLPRGAEVHVLTRDPRKAKALPDGVRGVTGDLIDPQTVRTAFRGMDSVFIVNTVSPSEAHEGLMAVNGAMLAQVGHVVYVSVQSADEAPYLPHFGSKFLVEQVIHRSGVPYTILRPNNFFQNDVWSRAALVDHGVYPQPIGGKGVSRVDVRDVAELAAIALTSDRHEGKTYNVVGPAPVTGTQCAEIWGNALGRPVKYAGDDLEAWQERSLAYMPPWLVFDFGLMYAWFQANGWVGTAEDIATMTSVLGHPPRDLESFARETAAAWKE